MAAATEVVRRGEEMEPGLAAGAARALAEAGVGLESKVEFLRALQAKGETAREIGVFARVLGNLAVDPGARIRAVAERGIDVVGTGGDKSGAFNFSTTVSFLLAAEGYPVLKHGNRGATSASGSADFLEGLGMPLEAGRDFLEASLEELGFAFFFARTWHPVFRQIAPARAVLAQEGRRTIFNVLGPLIHPARPASQYLGVFARELLPVMAGALEELGLARGWVAHGRTDCGQPVDKAMTAGTTWLEGVGSRRGERWEIRPENLGLAVAQRKDLVGGDAGQNRELLEMLAQGRGPAGLRDSVYLNAGACFWLLGGAEDLAGGVDRARAAVEAGRLRDWLARAREFWGKNR